MSFRNFLLAATLLLPTIFLRSQEGDGFLQGRLLDSQTQEPVVFATVRLKSRAVGVISDQTGGFKIPVSFRTKGDTLLISSMGYMARTIRLSALEEDRINTILLNPAVIELQESVITAKAKRLKAKDIVRYAIENIKENYPQEPFSYIGYYRDYQIKEDDYLNLNEALVEVNDKGFNTIDTLETEFLIYEYRKNRDFKIDSFAAKPYDYLNHDKVIPSAKINSYGGNELLLLRVHDPIRNHRLSSFSFIYRLQKDFIENHVFRLRGKTIYNGQDVYQIELYRNDSNFKVEGTLHIDVTSFAFRKVEYKVYQLVKKRKTQDAVSHYGHDNFFDTADENLLFKVILEYRQNASGENIMYPNYISFQNKFKVVRPPKFNIDRITLDATNRELEVFLNKPVANRGDLKLSDFKLRYRDKKVKLAKVVQRDAKTYLLEVDKDAARQRGLLNLLFSKTEDEEKKSLQLEIKNMKDRDGNLLGKREVETLFQFREFFVQEILPFQQGLQLQKYFMKKNRPLYDSVQPIRMPDRGKGYWMNTPLKRVE